MLNSLKLPFLTKIDQKLRNNDVIILRLLKFLLFWTYFWKLLVEGQNFNFISLFGKKLDGVGKFTYPPPEWGVARSPRNRVKTS